MFKTLKTVQKGFTIIELLIVIAIIAILALLVLNNFQGAQAKARDSGRTGDINALHAKLEEFHQEHSYYPETFTPADFPGIDAGALEDADGTPIQQETAVADVSALNETSPGNDGEYIYTPVDCNAGECTGYQLKTFIEREGGTLTNPYIKLGLNNVTP